MTEYETDPQRQPASSDASASNSGVSQQTSGLPWQAAAATPQGEAERSSAVPPSPAPPVSEWQQPGGWQPSQWQSTESGHPAYATPTYSAPGYPPAPGYPAAITSAGPEAAGTAYQPGWSSAPGSGIPPQQPPTWVHPGSEPRPGRRPGKTLASVAAVLALVVGSGVLGGWVAVQANDDTTTPTAASNTTISNPPPVINRSDLATVASAVQASVVTIITSSGEGSGVVYDSSGHIVTNNHVVATATGNTVQVNFNNGTKAQATIVGTDPKSDLAVIKVSDASALKAAKFGDSGSMRVGDTVLAIGSPLDLEGTVTAGIVSALDRTIQVGDDQQQQQPLSQQQQSQVSSISGLMQTDAPINPGNSGGALVNTNGEVIGINSAIATSGSSTGNIGVGFAIPSNKVKAVADQLIKGGKVSHPFLGVSVGDGQNGGAQVQSLTSGGPAAKAGLQQGDVITKINGKAVNSSDDVVSAVQAANVGDKLELTYTRNGAQKTATVTLAEAS